VSVGEESESSSVRSSRGFAAREWLAGSLREAANPARTRQS
jgi:hypothetical protein